MSEGRDDLRDSRCADCGARCVPGETHLEHNAGWIKKLLMWDWHEVCLDGYPGWDMVDPGGGHPKHPPSVRLAIRNDKKSRIKDLLGRKRHKGSTEIDREFDDVAVGRFYSRDFSRDGSCYVADGEWYDSQWWFQKREDAHAFVRRYGGVAG